MSGIDNLGGKRASGWAKGTSGNPGGQPSLKRDLERARMIGIPAEISAVLDEWIEEGTARLAELGANGFIAGLREAMTAAAARVLPMTPADARAMWWRTILPVAFAGPSGTKDSVWTYASQEVGVRLLGKPKETIALEDGTSTPIDWSKVPEAERPALGAAILKLQSYLSEPESGTEH